MKLSQEDIDFINQLPGNGPKLVETGIPDPHGGHYKLSPQLASAFSAANEDYKAVHGHDIPLASAYRDPDRNRRADGAPKSKHLHGDAFDIDRAAVEKAKPFLNAHGLYGIGGTWHGRSEDNHFELRGASHTAKQSKPVSSSPSAPAMAASPNVAPPTLDFSRGYAPLPDTLSNQFPTETPAAMAARKSNASLIKQASAPPATVQLPPAPDLAAIRENAGRFVESAAPSGVPEVEQKPFVNSIQGIGNIFNDVKSGVSNAAGGVFNAITHPVQTGQAIAGGITDEAAHTATPLDIGGGILGGAGLAVADLLNGISGLPADVANSYLQEKRFAPSISIPTGDLQKYLEHKGASAFVGGALPFFAAEALTAGGATPGVAARLAKAAGTGAAFGAANDTHGQGLGARAEGAVNMGALGLGLGALGEGARVAIPDVRFNEDLMGGTAPQVEADAVPRRRLVQPTQEQAPSAQSRDLAQAFENRKPTPEIIETSRPVQAVDEFGFPKGQGDAMAARELLGNGARLENGDNISIATKGGREIPDLMRGTSLPEGRDLSVDTSEQVYPTSPDRLPETKSASESARTFQEQESNMTTAQELAQDATRTRMDAESSLHDATGIQNPVEAQRALGQRLQGLEERINSGEALTPEEGAQWQSDRELLDHVLRSRQEEIEAFKLLENESKTTQRASLPEPPAMADRLPELTRDDLMSGTKPLRSSVDIAMERSFESKPKDLMSDTSNMQKMHITEKPVESSRELFSKPVDRSAELEIPGQKPKVEKLEILGPNGKPLSPPQSSKPASDVSHSFTSDAGNGEIEHVNPAKPRTAEIEQAAAEHGSQLMSIAEAQEFIRKHQPDQMQHLLNVIEAGKNNQTISVEHSPLEEGGRVINSREVSPVDIAKRTIKPQTEVSNLRKEYGDDAAVRDNLVQRLRKAGIDVTAQEQNITGLPRRSVSTRLNKLAAKLPDENRTHVYIVDHNLNTTAREGSYGFRRLDRIQKSSLTGNAQNLPAGPEYTNKIAPAFEAIQKIVSMDGAPPEMQRIIKQMASGKVSKNSIKDLREVLRTASKEVVEALCKV